MIFRIQGSFLFSHPPPPPPPPPPFSSILLLLFQSSILLLSFLPSFAHQCLHSILIQVHPSPSKHDPHHHPSLLSTLLFSLFALLRPPSPLLSFYIGSIALSSHP